MRKSNTTVLVITAHPDDEIIGLGGTLLNHRDRDPLHILTLCDGETARAHTVDVEKRKKQAHAVARKLGAQTLTLKNLPDNKLDTIPLLDIAKIIEERIAAIKPEIVYTHHANDLNIDHQRAAQAVLTACRPQPGFSVKKILAFETLSSTEWQIRNSATIFAPSYYTNITSYLDEKIEIMQLYKGELRTFPHPRSIEGIKILAQYRGMEVGYYAAEAFEVLRILND